MYSDIKVWKYTVKIWWYVFFFLQLALIVLMIGTFGAYYWVTGNFNVNSSAAFYGSSGSSYFNGNSFDGSISMCRDGCSNSYQQSMTDWCEIIGYKQDNTSKSLCELFRGLSGGGGLFVVFEIASMIGIISWGCAMLCFIKKRNCKCFCMTYCCSVCACVSHYIAVLGWIGVTQANFGGSCSSFPRDGSQPIVCASQGPKLGVFVLSFISIIVVFYLIIGCKVHAKKDLIDDAAAQGVQMPVYNASRIPQNQNPCMNYLDNPVSQPPVYLQGAPPSYVPGAPPVYVPGAPQVYAPGAPPVYIPGAPLAYVPGAPMYPPPQVYAPVNEGAELGPDGSDEYPKIIDENNS
jgi:hypothetical protein